MEGSQTMNDTNDEAILKEAFNMSIAEELMLDVNPNVTADEVARVWAQCKGNPWNAGILYSIMLYAKTKQ
jgi:hypothetical protein